MRYHSENTAERCSKESYRIDFIDSFPSFVTLTANPVSIEVGTNSIQNFAGKPVVFPLLSVELQHTLIHQIFSVLKARGPQL